jgi:hypothetical protein
MFRRTASSPAPINRRIVATSPVAGPSVARIFVLENPHPVFIMVLLPFHPLTESPFALPPEGGIPETQKPCLQRT